MITYIKKDQPQYKANLHCHSTVSDGKLTPAELKEAYKNHGYSILCITDHETPCDHTDMTEKDFLMLTGYEAYLRQTDGKHDAYLAEVHINLFAKDPHNVAVVNYNPGYCHYVKDEAAREALVKVGTQEKREYTVEYINEFVRIARENGYICSHNHPVWSMEKAEQVEAYEGFFTMEMCNYSSYTLNRMEYNAPLYDRLLRSGKRIFCHSADDNHNKQPFGHPSCDSFGGFAMVLAKDLTYPSVIEALEKGDFYSSMGPKILELTFDGDMVHIETEPVEQITMFTSGKKTLFVAGTEDAPVTSADFKIPSKTAYVRFDAVDFRGKHANTRGFFRDELGI